MDGFEALQCLKNNPSQANIPVIFLTATIDDSIKERGVQLGVIDFVVKPFSAADLINRMNKFFESNNK
jgi:CheY-like chemotaxis protein